MSDKFKEKYRIATARANWWDYRNPGLYFITICTHGMECSLGEITDDEMHLSAIGEIASTCWTEIPKHFTFVKLHTMVVMPNHVHGILEILPDANVETLNVETLNVETLNVETLNVETLHATSLRKIPGMYVQTLHATSLPIPPAKNKKMAAISPPKGSLASIIRSYKSAVSKKVHLFHSTFDWQERYYDNIIRDLPAYQRIETYIANNASSWKDDKFFQ
jgi:REP element-mobilizing transposase RayT